MTKKFSKEQNIYEMAMEMKQKKKQEKVMSTHFLCFFEIDNVYILEVASARSCPWGRGPVANHPHTDEVLRMLNQYVNLHAEKQ